MCQFCASVCAKPEDGISPHSLCGSLSVNVYLQCASHLTMEEKVQQCVCIDFCFRLGKSGAKTYEILQAAYGESCLIRSKTFEWYSHFKNGCLSYEDNPCPGRLSTSHTEETVACARDIICADWLVTIRKVAEEVRIAFGTCQKILTKICKWEVWQRNLCPVSWWWSGMMIVCQFALTSVIEPKTIPTSCPL
jgi:hypothetical protein